MHMLRQANGFRVAEPVLADDGFYPSDTPLGYAFIDDEPAFDPAIHLQLERPERIWTLADLGYDDRFIASFPSPIALTSPARLLSKAGVAAMKEISEKLQPFVRHRAGGGRVPAALRGTTFRSRFVRDFCLSPDVTRFFADLFDTPMMPHTVTHHQGHMNFAPKEIGTHIDAWHHDIIALDYVLMIHDPRTIQGGRFEVFMGTREEGAALVAEKGDIPRDRVYTPDFPDGGYACYMQGPAVFHRASRMEAPAFRASLVQSYVARDVRFPDPNRFNYIDAPAAMVDANTALERDAHLVEWARHRAWMSRAKLGWIMEHLPFDSSPQAVIGHLESAIADIVDIVEIAKAGRITIPEAQERSALLDRLQTGR